MNETLKCIQERFSCRDFTDQMPTDEQLHAIAQAAIQAPSGMNRQPCQVIVVKNKDLIAEMEEEGMKNIIANDEVIYKRLMTRGGTLFYHATCLFIIGVDMRNPNGLEMIDLGILIENAALAATSLGLASVHCGMIRYVFNGEKGESFRKRISMPEGYECGIAVLFGYPREIKAPHVLNQDKITYID